jgi:hypothetical protein
MMVRHLVIVDVPGRRVTGSVAIGRSIELTPEEASRAVKGVDPNNGRDRGTRQNVVGRSAAARELALI